MKALILLEYRFFKDSKNNYWCKRVIDYNYLKRYLNVFDSIIVAARTVIKEEIEENEYLLVSGTNVEFIDLPDFQGPNGLLKNYHNLLKKLKNAAGFDCVIMRGPNIVSLTTYKIFQKKNIPFAVEFVIAGDKLIDGNGFIKRIINKYLVYQSKKMCMAANGVSYVTNHILQEVYPCMAMKSQDSKYFTENYSSIDLFEDDFYKQDWNASQRPNQFKIIHTGYMDSYRKGQDTLIKAIKIVLDSGYNVELELIGDGQKRQEFEQLTEDLNIFHKVHFKGLIKDKKVILQELKSSHLFVFPTHSEGLPRSIIEAMAVGLPCITSPVDGNPELVDNHWLVDYDDYENYAKKIIEMISNWEKMVDISNDNYQKSKEYSHSNLLKKRNHFYEQLKGIACNEKVRI